MKIVDIPRGKSLTRYDELKKSLSELPDGKAIELDVPGKSTLRTYNNTVRSSLYMRGMRISCHMDMNRNVLIIWERRGVPDEQEKAL